MYPNQNQIAMQLEYKEILKLKGRRLIDTRHNHEYTVTSVTNNKITLNKGLKILTSIFYEHSQQFYELVDKIDQL